MDGRIRRKLAVRIAVVFLGMLVFVSAWVSAEGEETGIIERGVFKLDFRKGGNRSRGKLFFKGEPFFEGWAGFGLRDKDDKTLAHASIFEPRPDQIEEKDDYLELNSSKTVEDMGYTHTVRVKLYQKNKVKIILESKFSKDWPEGKNIFVFPKFSSDIMTDARIKVVDTQGKETIGVMGVESGPFIKKIEIYPVSGGKFTITRRCARNPGYPHYITHTAKDGWRFCLFQLRKRYGFPAGYYNQIELTFEYSEEANKSDAAIQPE